MTDIHESDDAENARIYGQALVILIIENGGEMTFPPQMVPEGKLMHRRIPEGGLEFKWIPKDKN